MRYRLVLFDFDGTLADSFPWFTRALAEVADEFRLNRVAPDAVDELRGMGPRQVMQRLGVSWWKVPMIARRMRQLMSTDAAAIQPFPGVDQMLRRLSDAGVVLGVVTSNAERNVRAILGDTSTLLTEWQCESSMFGKAARIRRLLRSTRVPPQQTICVGDEVRDAEAAHAAGVHFAAVTWGYATADALRAANPAFLFDAIEDVAPKLLGTTSDRDR